MKKKHEEDSHSINNANNNHPDTTKHIQGEPKINFQSQVATKMIEIMKMNP